jgi:hypothetical protein
VCARPVCPPFMQTDCAHWIDNVGAEMPTVVFVPSTCPTREPPTPQVSIDGTPLSNAVDGLPHPLDPGLHKVAVDQGGVHTEASLTLVVGDRNSRMTLPLPPALCPVPNEAAHAAEPNAASRSYLVWGLAGLGLTALGGALSIAGYVDSHTSTCNTDPSVGCPASQRSLVAGLLIGGNSAMGLGIVALAIGVVDFVISRPRRPTVGVISGWTSVGWVTSF